MRTITLKAILAIAMSISVGSIFASTVPTTLPVTPTVAASNAIFLYNSSGAYTNAAVLDFSDANQWGGLFTESTVAVAGKNLICFTPTTLSGTIGTYYHGGNLSATLNVSSMKYLHVDAWVPSTTNWTDFAIAPISSGNPSKNGQPLQSIFSSAQTGTWASFDILLSTIDATGLVDLTQVNQFIVKNSGNSSIATIDDNKIYLDNIYFWTDATDATVPEWDATTPVAVGVKDGTSIELLLKGTDNSGNVSYVISDGTKTYNAAGASGAITSCVVTPLTPATSYTFTITLKDPTGNTAAITKTIVASTLTMSPAATPTMPASDVISIYSDAYTSIIAGWQDWWGNKFETLLLNGNTTLKNASVCCFGTEFTSGVTDVSAMTKLHLDVFPTVATTISVGLVDGNGVEAKLPLTLTVGTWNGIDLPLTNIVASNSALDLTKIKQLGFWDVNGTFYLDNALFYKNSYTTGISSVISENEISCFPSLVKDELTVKASSKIKEIAFTNLSGQTLKVEKINDNSKLVDVRNLASGIYFVKIKMENGQTGSRKIVKVD